MPRILIQDKALLSKASELSGVLKCSVQESGVTLKDLTRVDLFTEYGIRRQINLLSGKTSVTNETYKTYANSMYQEQYENIDGFHISIEDIPIPENLYTDTYIDIVSHYFNRFVHISRDSHELSIISHQNGLIKQFLFAVIADLHDAGIPAESVCIRTTRELLDSIKTERAQFSLTMDDIQVLAGDALTIDNAKNALEHFGYDIQEYADNKLLVSPPFFRYDISTKNDILEDVILLSLRDITRARSFPIHKESIVNTSSVQLAQLVEKLLSFGFKEVRLPELQSSKKPTFTYSKYSLRESLAASLLKYESTIRHKKYPHKVFEIGNIFKRNKRYQNVCLIVVEDNIDFNELYSILHTILLSTFSTTIHLEDKEYPQYEKESSFAIKSGDTSIGSIGFVSDEYKRKYKIKKPCISAELYLSNLYS